jgi:hypothetical protein
MEQHVTNAEARLALDTVERSRLRVIDEIDLPAWYWWGLALCWIGLGFLADLNHAWITAAATLVFGAVHSAVAPRVVSGRHRTNRLSVRASVAGRDTARLVLAGLVGLGFLTVALGFAANADGARHASTVAAIFVALIILLGGPRLLAVVRERAAARSSEGS